MSGTDIALRRKIRLKIRRLARQEWAQQHLAPAPE
jgi:hypothetical protein